MPLGRRIDPYENNKQTQPQKTQNTNSAANVDKSTEFSLFHAEEPKYNFNDIILNKITYDAIQDVLAIYEKRELLFNEWGLGTTHKQQNRASINLYGASGQVKVWRLTQSLNSLDAKF